jgi:hypothetical protein
VAYQICDLLLAQLNPAATFKLPYYFHCSSANTMSLNRALPGTSTLKHLRHCARIRSTPSRSLATLCSTPRRTEASRGPRRHPTNFVRLLLQCNSGPHLDPKVACHTCIGSPPCIIQGSIPGPRCCQGCVSCRHQKSLLFGKVDLHINIKRLLIGVSASS